MLQIRKKGGKNFWHYYNSKEFSASDLRVDYFSETLRFKFTRENGAFVFLREGFLISEISIYDDTGAGTEETFVDPVVLLQRLISLGYNAYYEDGDVITDIDGGTP